MTEPISRETVKELFEAAKLKQIIEEMAEILDNPLFTAILKDNHDYSGKIQQIRNNLKITLTDYEEIMGGHEPTPDRKNTQGSISGKGIYSDETPVEGVYIKAFSTDTPAIQRADNTEKDGKFNFLDLPVGTYHLTAFHNGRNGMQIPPGPITITNDMPNAIVFFEFEKAAGEIKPGHSNPEPREPIDEITLEVRISGKAQYHDGKVASFIPLTFKRKGETNVRTIITTKNDGSFSIKKDERLPAGIYEIMQGDKIGIVTPELNIDNKHTVYKDIVVIFGEPAKPEPPKIEKVFIEDEFGAVPDATITLTNGTIIPLKQGENTITTFVPSIKSSTLDKALFEDPAFEKKIDGYELVLRRKKLIKRILFTDSGKNLAEGTAEFKLAVSTERSKGYTFRNISKADGIATLILPIGIEGMFHCTYQGKILTNEYLRSDSIPAKTTLQVKKSSEETKPTETTPKETKPEEKTIIIKDEFNQPLPKDLIIVLENGDEKIVKDNIITVPKTAHTIKYKEDSELYAETLIAENETAITIKRKRVAIQFTITDALTKVKIDGVRVIYSHNEQTELEWKNTIHADEMIVVPKGLFGNLLFTKEGYRPENISFTPVEMTKRMEKTLKPETTYFFEDQFGDTLPENLTIVFNDEEKQVQEGKIQTHERIQEEAFKIKNDYKIYEPVQKIHGTHIKLMRRMIEIPCIVTDTKEKLAGAQVTFVYKGEVILNKIVNGDEILKLPKGVTGTLTVSKGETYTPWEQQFSVVDNTQFIEADLLPKNTPTAEQPAETKREEHKAESVDEKPAETPEEKKSENKIPFLVTDGTQPLTAVAIRLIYSDGSSERPAITRSDGTQEFLEKELHQATLYAYKKGYAPYVEAIEDVTKIEKPHRVTLIPETEQTKEPGKKETTTIIKDEFNEALPKDLIIVLENGDKKIVKDNIVSLPIGIHKIECKKDNDLYDDDVVDIKEDKETILILKRKLVPLLFTFRDKTTKEPIQSINAIFAYKGKPEKQWYQAIEKDKPFILPKGLVGTMLFRSYEGYMDDKNDFEIVEMKKPMEFKLEHKNLIQFFIDRRVNAALQGKYVEDAIIKLYYEETKRKIGKITIGKARTVLIETRTDNFGYAEFKLKKYIREATYVVHKDGYLDITAKIEINGNERVECDLQPEIPETQNIPLDYQQQEILNSICSSFPHVEQLTADDFPEIINKIRELEDIK